MSTSISHSAQPFSSSWLRVQDLLEDTLSWIPNFLLGLVVFALFVLAARWLRRIVMQLAQRAGQPRSTAMVLARVSAWALNMLGFMLASVVMVPSLDGASLFSALGIGGVAIGFAFKDIFQNLFAGLLLMITRPFRIGDQIITGNHEGTIEDILVRSTQLRTYDNRVVIIPNSELFTNRVLVNTANESRRSSVQVVLPVGLSLEEESGVEFLQQDQPPRTSEKSQQAANTEADAEPSEAQRQALIEAVAHLDDLRTDKPVEVLLQEVRSHQLVWELRYWTSPARRRSVLEAQDAVLQALFARFPGVEARPLGT